jgi:hypothetical protein
MSNRSVVLAFLLLLACPYSSFAQTIYADRFGLVTGPCLITSGAGDPTNTVNGNRCDTYVRTDTGDVYTKQTSGFTSTGWGIIPRLSVANVWTANQTIANASPALLLTATGAGANLKTWAVGVTGTALTLSTLNDALGTLITPLSIDRAGNASILGGAAIGGNATIGGTAGITGAVTLGSTIGTATYASQITGWRIDQTGAADFRYLFTDELRAKLFTADMETVLAGSERITKSYSTVAQPFTCPAAGAGGTLWVNDASTYGDAPVFQTGDFVVLHVLTRATFGPFTITDCVGSVTAYTDGTGATAGQQSWTFARAAGANGGAMAGGAVVPVNQLVQDLGVSGNGYVEMSAVDGANGSNAPYLQTNTWTTSPTAANTTTNCRLGNLNGITALNDYGLLCGKFVLNGPFFWMSTRGIEMRNLALTMYDNGTQVFTVDPNAGSPILALGNPMPTAYGGANKGIWMGKDTDGTYKARIGNPAGNRLTWDGNVLSIAGEGSGITNINGGNIQAGTISAAQLSITAHPGGASISPDPNIDDTSLWADQSGGAVLPAIITTIPDGVVGTKSMRSQTGHQAIMGSSYYWPLDIRKTYRAHVWVRASPGATGGFYVQMSAVGNSGGASAYLGTFSLGLQNLPVSTTWTEYNAVIPPGVLPAATTNANWYVVMNNGATTPVGYLEFQDLRYEEVVPGTLIKDGAITTNKILAGSITGDRIAANTITVGNLNATGFGDNLIKNSTFEGSDNPAQAIAGWIADPQSTGYVQYGCCGTRGPGALVLTASAAQANVLASYLAVPIQIGIPYRVAMDIYTASGTASGVYIYAIESQSYAMPRHIVSTGSPTAPDVLMDTITTFYTNGPIIAGWQHFEFTYTPLSPVRWAAIGIHNYTCTAGGATCQNLYLDAVEMQPQLGAGHIRANSITADRLVANSIGAGQITAGSITSAQIAAGTITGGNIAGGTITGGNIAGRTITAGLLVANTITSNEIGVRAIVAGNIATGTLTANELAANTITGDRIAAGTIIGGNIAGNTIIAYNIQSGTITADKLNVSTLSAITANLGTVTAGSINSVSINGSSITGGSININGGNFQVDSSGNVQANGSFNVGGTANIQALNAGYQAGISTVNFNGNTFQASGGYFSTWNLQNGGNRFVCADNSGRLYPATNGTSSATC